MPNRLKIWLVVAFFLILSSSCAFAEGAKQIIIDTLVIPSRNQTRMQPEIFYAFKTAAKEKEPLLKMRFVLFNPFQHEFLETGGEELQGKLLALSYKCVDEVLAIKKANPQTQKLLKHIRDYMQQNPGSHLAELHRIIEGLMEEFEFLIIESSDTYGIHPMFYKPGITQINTPDGANEKDIIEALYGFFFLDAAFKENKPVWGTCHGAQIGYIHAGGKLERLFNYKEDGYDVDFKKAAPGHVDEEIWHIEDMLYTKKKDADYTEYGTTVYPVPETFKGESRKNEEMYMNKDFEHSLALTKPIPEGIQAISYHPLSKYQDKVTGKKHKEFNKEFKKILKNQAIIDAYKYKTMLGTQYHPQYTYDDLETSMVFDYLVKQLADRYKNQ